MNNKIFKIIFLLLLNFSCLAQTKISLQKSNILYQNDSMSIIQDWYKGLIDSNDTKSGITMLWILYDVSKQHKIDTIFKTYSQVTSLKCDGHHMSIVTVGMGHAFALLEKTHDGWVSQAAISGGAFYDKYTNYELIHTGLFTCEEKYDRTGESKDMIEKRKLTLKEHNRYYFNINDRRVIRNSLILENQNSEMRSIDSQSNFLFRSKTDIRKIKSEYNNLKYF